ncbi:hypothetical protein ACN38_g2729 [Penicillium nordicum]|uniref:Uncharacterized protein n=1 Tax=Penicillium nordicum TaxID=229535 RepID=A0A0M9WIP3_9EURO|nr:hypothetical protein ACN38_g2729 [Penicillium nordicum]
MRPVSALFLPSSQVFGRAVSLFLSFPSSYAIWVERRHGGGFLTIVVLDSNDHFLLKSSFSGSEIFPSLRHYR